MKPLFEVSLDMGQQKPIVVKVLDAAFHLSIDDANELAGSLIRAVNLAIDRKRRKKK
jgi:hypothetical protein